MMRENNKELDGLIREVMDQMDERGYGKKIVTRHRASFQLLMSISHDIGDDKLSEKLIKAFLDRPVRCSEKWIPKELTHRKRCIRLLLSLAQSGTVDWRRQDTGGMSGKLLNEAFRVELESFARYLEQEAFSPNTISGYKRIVTYFLLFCQKTGMESYPISGQMMWVHLSCPFTKKDGTSRLRSEAAWRGCAGFFPPTATRHSSSWRYRCICRRK